MKFLIFLPLFLFAQDFEFIRYYKNEEDFQNDVRIDLIKASKIEKNHFLNIGTGVETSVNELANSMKTQFNSMVNAIYKPAREGELVRSVLNNTKAKQELDWEPEYSLDDGMKEVFNWLRA